jgi:beta-lactam-binding protein with PASTA domain
MKQKTKTFVLPAVLISATLMFSSCAATVNDANTENSGSVDTTSPNGAMPETTVSSDTTPPSSPSPTTETNIAGGNDPEDFLMPNVICMNLQEAQDEIQDHGVFYSRSTDLTGQDRNQIIDSNWIVLQQTPAPGTRISEGDAVLGVVRIGESTRGIC